MAYSLVGIIAIFVHLIVNIDVFFDFRGKRSFSGERYYLFFLMSAILFHITDACWGFINDAHLVTGLFIDTTLYFVAMALSILFWGLFVYHYLGESTKKRKTIVYIGIVVFALQIISIIVNFFYPVLFNVDENCVYSAGPVRYAMLGIQVLMFPIVAIYSFIASIKLTDSAKRRHVTIGLFGLFMIVAIFLQVFFPLQPFYSLGFLLGITALHTFVVEDEKAIRRVELEEAKHQIAIDPLTGVMSKHAYVDYEAEIDQKINEGSMSNFAVIVFDLNNLKKINDTDGHEAGDQYIIAATKLIGEYFKDAPLFRVGGDEFAAFLLDEAYESRDIALKAFNSRIDLNLRQKNRIIVSAGMSVYIPGEDNTILQIFTRADREMYNRKHELKARVKE